jgi:hypothetical protein
MFRLFRVLMSEMLGRLFPVFTLLLWQRQHIIVVDNVDYKNKNKNKNFVLPIKGPQGANNLIPIDPIDIIRLGELL